MAEAGVSAAFGAATGTIDGISDTVGKHIEGFYSSDETIKSRLFGRGYYNDTFLSYGKFASLAKYYSGREDIIYKRSAFRKKKKMYEKDW